MMRIWLAAGALAAALVAGTPALAAVNLITNGSFETGNFSSWTRVGAVTREAGRVVRTAALEGTWGGRFSANSGYPSAGISQTFATPNFMETTYTVSFSFRHTVGKAEFPQYGLVVSTTSPTVYNSGTELIDYHNRFAENYDFPNWTYESFTVRASSETTTLNFLFFDIYSTAWDLDAISVVEEPFTPYLVESAGLASAVVPEPSTWALLITGLAAAGTALRRRRSAVAG